MVRARRGSGSFQHWCTIISESGFSCAVDWTSCSSLLACWLTRTKFPWLSRLGSSQICRLRSFSTWASLSAHEPGNKWQDAKATWHYWECSAINRESLRFVQWSRWPFRRTFTAVVVVWMLKYLDIITLLECISVAFCIIKIFIHALKSHSCHGRKALPAIPSCLRWGIHVSCLFWISVRGYMWEGICQRVYVRGYLSEDICQEYVHQPVRRWWPTTWNHAQQS